MILTLLWQLEPMPPAIEGTAQLYVWIIYSLIVFILGLLAYVKVEHKLLKTELKDERDYSRVQGEKNIALIENVNGILTQLVKLTDKTVDSTGDIHHVVTDISPIIKANVAKLDQIKNDINNRK